jgi:uncharacterized protein (DUF3084 family)
MQDTTSSIRATYQDIPKHQSLGYSNTLIIILSYSSLVALVTLNSEKRNMRQEDLLKSIKEELKHIQKQLTTIQQSLEELREKSEKKNVDTTKAKTTKSSINKAHKEARRFAHSWSEK